MLETEHEAFATLDQTSAHALDSHTVGAALQALSTRQRQAITLLKLQERSLKEAAEQSGMSIASLKVSAHRGIKALRRLLGEGGN
jgi:RNA polymerase sigma-70 factor, ECF subfamily